MTTFRVKAGQKISIAIDRDAPETGPETEDKGPDFIGVDQSEDQLYVFPKKGIPIFSLGWEYVGDGNYATIDERNKRWVTWNGTASVPTVEFTLADYFGSMYVTQLGGSDVDMDDPDVTEAFGTTDDHPNRRKFEHASEKYYLDFTADIDDANVKSIIGKAERPFLSDIVAGGANGTNTLWKKGLLSKKVRNASYLRFESFGRFYGFDTNEDTEFKITDVPIYGADAVELDLTGLTEIYLVPLIVNLIYSYNFRINTGGAPGSNFLAVNSFGANYDSILQDIDVPFPSFAGSGGPSLTTEAKNQVAARLIPYVAPLFDLTEATIVAATVDAGQPPPITIGSTRDEGKITIQDTSIIGGGQEMLVAVLRSGNQFQYIWSVNGIRGNWNYSSGFTFDYPAPGIVTGRVEDGSVLT